MTEHTARLPQDGTLVRVRATPKASRNEITGIRNGEVVVKVTAPPDKGKANAAIQALLAKSLGVPKSACELVGGEASRHKSFRLAINSETVQNWLRGLADQQE